MNLPNYLTLSRFFMSACFAVLALSGGRAAAAGALAIFVLAVLTDWADGYLARRTGQVTSFGKIMDPLADKCLTLTAFFIFAVQGVFSLALVALIALREVLVTAFRIEAVTRRRVIPAETSGKVKTALQMATIILVLVAQAIQPWLPYFVDKSSDTGNFIWYLLYWLTVLSQGMMIVAAVVTVTSGLSFFRAMRSERAHSSPRGKRPL